MARVISVVCLFLLAMLGQAASFSLVSNRLPLASPKTSMRSRFGALSMAEPEADAGKKTWTVTDDTAEIEWGSSTDVKTMKVAKAQKGASGSTSATPVVPVGTGKEGTSGFDVGLLIAFPIIVGTLGFFFLFPILGPQLAANLPPVPKDF